MSDIERHRLLDSTGDADERIYTALLPGGSAGDWSVSGPWTEVERQVASRLDFLDGRWRWDVVYDRMPIVGHMVQHRLRLSFAYKDDGSVLGHFPGGPTLRAPDFPRLQDEANRVAAAMHRGVVELDYEPVDLLQLDLTDRQTGDSCTPQPDDVAAGLLMALETLDPRTGGGPRLTPPFTTYGSP